MIEVDDDIFCHYRSKLEAKFKLLICRIIMGIKERKCKREIEYSIGGGWSWFIKVKNGDVCIYCVCGGQM